MLSYDVSKNFTSFGLPIHIQQEFKKTSCRPTYSHVNWDLNFYIISPFNTIVLSLIRHQLIATWIAILKKRRNAYHAKNINQALRHNSFIILYNAKL
jgi:uncharacterized membrane protein YozB (DUF420 family)